MIKIRSLENRTYEELMQEAIGEIPLYTKEWTNFNPSDPGITILENLTAFQILQQNHIEEITPSLKKKLLQLAGFHENKGKCARILLGADNVTSEIFLPAGQRFYLGDLSFETNKAITLSPWEITRIFSKTAEGEKEFTFLTDPNINIPAYIFGDDPKPLDSVYFVTNGLPEAGEEIIFYLNAAEARNRNPFLEKGKNLFAELTWECYTVNGYEIMQVKDYTSCFLVSGEIRMRITSEPAICKEEGIDGYVIRATLKKAEYDRKPKVFCVDGFLFEAFQRETLSACYTLQKACGGRIQSELLKYGYLSVFGKEEKGSCYYKYEPSQADNKEGRFYDAWYLSKDHLQISFHRKKYKFAPAKLKAPIKVLLYNEEMMRKYALGEVKGYDRQRLPLPVANIVPETFTIMAVRTREDGENLYDFVRPGYSKRGALHYHLYEKEGWIEIEDAGIFVGARLYMASCSITSGPEGNIRDKNTLIASGRQEQVFYYNRGEGKGGSFRESLAELEERFFKDLYKTYTAVTAYDYEKLVKETPELCIHKVRAFMKEEKNMVKIAVKPDTEEKLPGLSESYKKAIYDYLEDKRLLSTKLMVVEPQYVPVDVYGTIYVSNQYLNAKEEIYKTIEGYVDYIYSNKNFGDTLKFDGLYHALQQLDCVELIYDLHMMPQKAGLAKVRNEDIFLTEESLCYMGDFYLQIRTNGG